MRFCKSTLALTTSGTLVCSEVIDPDMIDLVTMKGRRGVEFTVCDSAMAGLEPWVLRPGRGLSHTRGQREIPIPEQPVFPTLEDVLQALPTCGGFASASDEGGAPLPEERVKKSMYCPGCTEDGRFDGLRSDMMRCVALHSGVVRWQGESAHASRRRKA